MLRKTLFFAAALLLSTATAATVHAAGQHPWRTSSRIAAGEWRIEVQTPPCDGARNLEVIYPHHPGDPIAIECNDMPVPTR